MFLTLLAVTFLIALATSVIVAWLFKTALSTILTRIVSPPMAAAWHRYLNFALCVVGVSGGVRVGHLEHYVISRLEGGEPLVLTFDRWILEVYRALIGTLQGAAWLLLVFFVVALIAYVITRGFELRHGQPGKQVGEPDERSS